MNVKVAVVQTDPQLGNLEHNLDQAILRIQEASRNGAKLFVFPECSLTGYCFGSEELARKHALRVHEQKEWIARLQQAAGEANGVVIVGLVETDDIHIYNSLLVIGSEGILGKYQKCHLPCLGVDNYAQPGDEPFQIIETPVGRLGALICYDARFPEHARILSLDGADILIHITNLPLTASAHVDFLLPARAIENRIFVLSSDRVGVEEGFAFLGRSSIFGVNGETLAQANDRDEMIIYADLDLSLSRNKQVYYPASEGKPVEHVNDLVGSRRPELYTRLIQR